jgi:hypothetical protein
MSFILAKQAGLDIEFSYADLPLPESKLYLMPSLCGDAVMTGGRFSAVLEKVKAGAVLYLSMHSGLLSPFSEFTGVRVITREKSGRHETIRVKNNGQPYELQLYSAFKLKLELCGAQALAEDTEGNPIYTVYPYGKGKVYFCALPLEAGLLGTGKAFGEENRYSDLYAPLKADTASGKAARTSNRNIGLTEHILDDKRRILILINHDPKEVNVKLNLAEGWSINQYYHGSLTMPNNSGTIVLLSVI